MRKYINLINNKNGELWFWGGIVLLSILALFLIRYTTPYGMGLVNDSVAYIKGAENILEGNGYSRIKGDGTPNPITHFPPFFSLVLVVFNTLGLGALPAVRLLNVCFFGVNVILIGVIIRLYSGSRNLGLLGALFFLLSGPFIWIHSYALSEPLYLFLFLSIVLIFYYYYHTKTWYLLIVIGLLSSMAYLTRYVGVSIYATVMFVLIVNTRKILERFKEVGLYLLGALPAVLVWTVRNIKVSGNATNRPVAYHPISMDVYQQGLENFFGWFIPDRVSQIEKIPQLWLMFFCILLIGILIYWLFLEKKYWQKCLRVESGNQEFIGLVISSHALAYMAMLFIAMTFFDDRTIFEHRILSPFYTSFLILFLFAGFWIFQKGNKTIKISIAVFSFLFLSIVAVKSLSTVRLLHEEGQGYAGGRWRNSEVIEYIKTKLPDDVIIFSNKITAIELLTERTAFIIPSPFAPPDEPDPSYWGGIKAYQEMVLDEEAVIIIFDYEPLVSTGERRIVDIANKMPVQKKCWDGYIFGTLE